MEEYEISVVRGDDYELTVRWKDSLGVQVPIASARLQVRRSLDATEKLLELTSTPAAGLTIGGGADTGTISVVITDAQTAALGSGGVWDIEATSVAGKIKTLVGGRFRLEKDVSR